MLDITKAEAARLRADADGRFTLVVLRPADIAGLIEAADGGNVVAWQTLRTGNAFLERCRVGATFCSCCGGGLAGKMGVIILYRPSRDDAREAVALGLCRDCTVGRTEQEIGAVAIERLCGAFPELAELGDAAAAGRA